jgi:hypothetical protein
MKVQIRIVFTIFILFFSNAGFGQMADSAYQKRYAYVEKGTTFISGGISFLAREEATQGYYRVISGEAGVGYYIFRGLALKAAVIGQHLNARGITTIPIKELDQVNLFLGSGQVRYNFNVMPDAGSIFFQAGYSFGDLPNKISKDLWRWEILSTGLTINSTKSKEPRFGIEAKVGIEKNNLSKVLMFSASLGVNYFITCKSCNIRKVKMFPRLNDPDGY